jgi:xanthine dehydrogenase accessory factor
MVGYSLTPVFPDATNQRHHRLDSRLDTSLELVLDRATADETPKVLATVVGTAGSTYRKPGARMLIMADGSHLGLLSGGCLEADLKIHANQVLDSGLARAIEYDMRGPDDVLFGIGAGCEGALRVLLEPAGSGTRAASTICASERAIRAGLPTSLVIVHESVRMPLGTYCAESPLCPRLISTARDSVASAASRSINIKAGRELTRAFVQFLAPSPRLLICGAGPDVQPVASTARLLGWRVTIVDHRPAYAISSRFPGADVHLIDPPLLRKILAVERYHAAVVMSHHLPSDAIYLRELAEADAPGYVGLLGPVARRQRLANELGPLADRLRSRIRGPVGLNLGAVTPEGIALAIISQIHAWLAGRDAAL